MIKLRWTAYRDSTVSAFKVYRSIPGLVIPYPNNLLTGMKLKLCATSPDVQTYTVNELTIEGMVAEINAAIRGVRASASSDGSQIFIRLLSPTGRLKLLKSDGLTALNLEPQIIVPELNFQLLQTVPTNFPTLDYFYNDDDGDKLDSYYLTSVDEGIESVPGIIAKPVQESYEYCIIEGRFIDPQGMPLKDVLVRLSIAQPQDTGIGVQKVSFYSDKFGRVAIPVIQLHQYYLEIPSIGYNEKVDIPADRFANFLDLPVTNKHMYSPFGDPS